MKDYKIFIIILLLSFIIIKNQSTDESYESENPTYNEPTDTLPIDTSDVSVNGTESDTTSSQVPDTTSSQVPDTTSFPSPDTTSFPVPPSTESPLIILLGYSGFKHLRNNGPRIVVYEFYVYFYRIRGQGTPGRILTFTINIIYYLRLLRQLQGMDADVPVNCTANDKKNNGDEDMFPFQCNFESNRTLNTVKSNDNYKFGDGNVSYIISSQANASSNFINEQTNENFPSYYTLNETTLNVSGLDFTFNGIMQIKEPKLEENDKQVLLAFDIGRGEGVLKNVSCQIVPHQIIIQENKTYRNYSLECSSDDSINAELNGVSGNINDYKVLLVLMKDEHTKLVTGANYESLYKRGSSSGLSGGAIAAIVIAFVIALIALAIIVMMCKKKVNVPAPFQESTLGINTNSISQ
jgi:hypothetical protein